MVPGDDDDAADGPAVDEHDPEGVLEPGLVRVDGRYADGALHRLPAEVDEEGWHDVLDSGPGVAPGHPHQELDAGGCKRDPNRRQEGQEREEAVSGVP